MDAIVVDDLRKTYVVREGFRSKKFIEALKGITFSVRKGTIHALLGPNGAGKTTTIKILATLLTPDGGKALVYGYDVVKEAKEVRKRVGVALDVSKGFYASLSGYENLIFYGLLRGMPFSYVRKRANELLELVELTEASRRPYYTYSLGMRARLSIAKALFSDPDVVLLDEPTLGLDVESARMVRKLLKDLTRDGKTVVISGHNMHEIELLADTVTIISNGRVVVSGSPSELKSKLGFIYRVNLRVKYNGSKLAELLRRSLSVEDLHMNDSLDSINIVTYVRMNKSELIQSLLKVLKDYEGEILDLSIEEPTLEDAYIALVGG